MIQTYRCEFYVFLVGNDGFSQGTRWVDLPFVPYEGLEILGLYADDDTDTMQVERVVYRMTTGDFLVDLGKDDPRDGDDRDMLKQVYGQAWEWEDR